jgi:hypothetical protein
VGRPLKPIAARDFSFLTAVFKRRRGLGVRFVPIVFTLQDFGVRDTTSE